MAQVVNPAANSEIALQMVDGLLVAALAILDEQSKTMAAAHVDLALHDLRGTRRSAVASPFSTILDVTSDPNN